MSDRKESDAKTDPEVNEKPVRRRFDAAYKLRILEQADRCTERGQLGELLRREGLYSSHLANWRRLREQGSLQSLGQKNGVARANVRTPRQKSWIGYAVRISGWPSGSGRPRRSSRFKKKSPRLWG